MKGFVFMGQLILIIVFLVIYFGADWIADTLFTNRIPPEGREIDYTQMTKDIQNGMSKTAAELKCIRGHYDVDKKE